MSAYHKGDALDEEDLLRQMEYTIRSGAVDEKAAAVQSLASFIEQCGKGYLPFVASTLNVCKESLEYPHEFVRHGIAAVLHELVKLAARCFPLTDNKMQAGAQEIVGRCLPLLLEMMRMDPDKMCCAEAVDAAKECVESFKMPILQVAGEPLVETLIVLLQEKAPCQSYHGEDEDEKDEQDHDEVLIDHVTDLLSAIAKAAGPSTFEPIFRRVVPNLLKFNQPNRDAPDRLMAIGTIGDIAEEMKSRVEPYLNDLFPIIIKSLGDENAGVRRNGAYTVGILTVHGGEAARPFFSASIEALSRLLDIPKDQKDDQQIEACRDNATSAISKIMGKDRSLQQPPVIDLLMAGVPLLNDLEEASEVYSRMAQLLQSHQNHMAKHLKKVLYVCGVSFANEELAEGVKNGLIPTAKKVAQTLGSQGTQNAMQNMSQAERQILVKVLSS